jgi:acyl-CoA thioesterase
MHPLKAGGGRGLYRGTIRDRDGNLAAMLNQEILLRWPSV